MKREDETRNITEGIPVSISGKAPEGSFLHPRVLLPQSLRIAKGTDSNMQMPGPAAAMRSPSQRAWCNQETVRGPAMDGEQPARTKWYHVRRER